MSLVKSVSSRRESRDGEESEFEKKEGSLESDVNCNTRSSARGDRKYSSRRRKHRRRAEADPPWRFSWEKTLEELEEMKNETEPVDLGKNCDSARKLKKFQTLGQLQVVVGLLFILMVLLCGTSLSSQEYFNLMLQNHTDVMWIFMLSTLVSFYSGFYAIYASYDPRCLKSYYLRLSPLLCLPVLFVMRSLVGLENIVSHLRTFMMLMQNRFSRTIIARSFWNHLQQGAECCGIDSPDDWKQYLSLIEGNLDKFPQSCCKDSEHCSLRNPLDSWSTGCYKGVLHGSLWTGLCLCGICVAQIAFQVLTVLLARKLYQRHSLLLRDGRTVTEILLGPFASLCWSNNPLRDTRSYDVDTLRYSASWNKERFKQNKVGPFPHLI